MAQDFCQDHCWRIDIGLWRCSEKVAWGEVYRADDLTLGPPAALKFLPEEAAKDAALVGRFRGEVRISARCRIRTFAVKISPSHLAEDAVSASGSAFTAFRAGTAGGDCAGWAAPGFALHRAGVAGAATRGAGGRKLYASD